MPNKLKYLFLIFISSLISCSNKSGKNDVTEIKLKGNVLSLTESVYTRKGNLEYREISKYDKEGNRIQFFSYDTNDSLFSFTVFEKQNGNSQKSIAYLKDSSVLSVVTTTYDDLHNMIMYVNNKGGKGQFNYDAKGNLLEEINYSTDGTVYSRILYKYDKQGNEIEKKIFNEDKLLGSTFVMEYNSEGLMIKKKDYNYQNELKFIAIYEYSNFDKYGNWLIQKMIFENELSRIKVRKIEYY